MCEFAEVPLVKTHFRQQLYLTSGGGGGREKEGREGGGEGAKETGGKSSRG